MLQVAVCKPRPPRVGVHVAHNALQSVALFSEPAESVGSVFEQVLVERVVGDTRALVEPVEGGYPVVHAWQQETVPRVQVAFEEVCPVPDAPFELDHRFVRLSLPGCCCCCMLLLLPAVVLVRDRGRIAVFREHRLRSEVLLLLLQRLLERVCLHRIAFVGHGSPSPETREILYFDIALLVLDCTLLGYTAHCTCHVKPYHSREACHVALDSFCLPEHNVGFQFLARSLVPVIDSQFIVDVEAMSTHIVGIVPELQGDHLAHSSQ
mmetsp:Transcript_41977/g.82437  ORF Transcript_41977/g.82437 Transcript_41977/m.82437 type:complete len:265 (+) Transcript_41977:510-1304(+)